MTASARRFWRWRAASLIHWKRPAAVVAVAFTLAQAGPAHAAAGQSRADFGLLLLTADGSRELGASLKSLGSDFHIEQAPLPDTKALQKAVIKLEGKKVKKIVALPLFISNHATAMDQLRYLLGIRREPSRLYLTGPHAHAGDKPVKRVKSKLPLVLAPALDDQPLAAEILAELAKKISRNPAEECLLVLITAGPGDTENSQWTAAMASVAEAARRRGGFRKARPFVLSAGLSPEQRDKSRRELRKLTGELKREGKVIAVSWSETPDAVAKDFFEGDFITLSPLQLTANPKIADWARDAALKAARLPDMRTFKDDGLPIPAVPDARRRKFRGGNQ